MYEASPWAVAVFVMFVGFVLWISYYFARRTKSAKGYFAAGGNIHWSVNGIAFAGDYLSAASFLGICGMIAVYGYDGFLYSIGYLAGWIVALFVIAEPMKRLGTFTFTDALDSKFNSRSIQLTAAISTLVVSICYLIPQMVGAGTLVTPLLGLPHAAGVILVGAIVIIIVATAGMASTTYVQFLKGGLLLVFSIAIVLMTLYNGLTTKPEDHLGQPYHDFKTLAVTDVDGQPVPIDKSYTLIDAVQAPGDMTFATLAHEGKTGWWHLTKDDQGKDVLTEAYWVTHLAVPIHDDRHGNLPSTHCTTAFRSPKASPLQAGHIKPSWYSTGQVVEEGTKTSAFPDFPRRRSRNSTIVRFLKKILHRWRRQFRHRLFYQHPTAGTRHSHAGPEVQGRSRQGRHADGPAEFRIADDGAVLRNRGPAAYPDPLLHRAHARRGAQEHDRGHCRDQSVLRAHAVHGPGGHGQRRGGSHGQQYVGPASGAAVSELPSLRSSRPLPLPPCWAPSAG